MSATVYLTDLQMETLQAVARAGRKTNGCHDVRIAVLGQKLFGDDWKAAVLLSNHSYLVLNRTLGLLLRKGLLTRFEEANDSSRWALSAQGRDLLGLPS